MVAVALTSAKAVVRMPASARYAVRSQLTSGQIHVGVPQASTADRTVTARIDFGDLVLLPS